jgi:hypothetical protein
MRGIQQTLLIFTIKKKLERFITDEGSTEYQQECRDRPSTRSTITIRRRFYSWKTAFSLIIRK